LANRRCRLIRVVKVNRKWTTRPVVRELVRPPIPPYLKVVAKRFGTYNEARERVTDVK
jgi:hypothetical protein